MPCFICVDLLPRSWSSPCIVVEGKTMLWGLIGLVGVGLVPDGLGAAYEKYFVRGVRAVLCCGKGVMNKNCETKSHCVWKLMSGVSVPLTLSVTLGWLCLCGSELTGAPGCYRGQNRPGQSDSDTSTTSSMTRWPARNMIYDPFQECIYCHGWVTNS